MDYTKNLSLKKPGYSDPMDIKDLNDNFDRIDEVTESIKQTVNEIPDNKAFVDELIDVRKNHEGKIYENAGEAVRELGRRISALEDAESIIPDPLKADDLGLSQDSLTGVVYPTYQGVRSSTGIVITAAEGKLFRVRSLMDSLAFSAAYNKPLSLKYLFTSTDAGILTGKGTASYVVNGTLVYNQSVEQGEVSFECGPYLVPGSNTITVTVTDADGEVKSLTWDITCIEIRLSSTFDYTLAYERDITFKFTAYGDVEKTVHFILDGVERDPMTVPSTGRQSTKLFENISHGLHTLDVYATAVVNGSDVESNHLTYDVIVIRNDSVAPVISINYSETDLVQGEIVNIPWIAYDPLATESTVELTIASVVDGEEIEYSKESRTVDRSLQRWSTRNYPLGTVKFTISLREVKRSIILNVVENKLPISPATNDLELHLSSANRSNREPDPSHWEYNGITTTFNDVNWASSGWVTDDIGDTSLHLASGTSAVINFKPFSEDLRIYGKTIEFDFLVSDVNNRDSKVISCKSGNIGIEITADTATLSSNLDSIHCYFSDKKRIRIAFVIESRSEYRLMSIYLNGYLTRAMQYKTNDNFQQFEPVDITVGSAYSSVDLYTVRSYSTALTQEELLNNYICDIGDLDRKMKLYESNDLYDDARNLVYDKMKKKIPVLTIVGPLPASKGDKKTVYIDYEDFQDESMNFKDRKCKIDVQGTSSQWYVRKNYKTKYDEEFSHIKGAIPAAVFCLKADYAEATSTHNTGNANFIHTLYSDLTPAQEVDERCRTTIQGFPIVVYHKETADSTPRFLGKYNYNYDKGSEAVFGFTSDFDVESWEFCNNTSDACNFLGNIPAEYSMKDADDNEVGWSVDFERRYPEPDDIEDGKEDPTVAIARFRTLHDWIVSTKNYDLSDPETLARYRSEFEERFNLHKTLVYYIYTFFMLMVDQRAKNMFLTYWGATGKWEPWFYDNDTCLGINNEGDMVFDYYHEDTDYLDESTKVYNGQDSVLWNQFRVAYADKIAETYRELRGSTDKDTGVKNGKLTDEKIREAFVTNGSDRWSQSIYNEDSDFKYLSMLRSEGDANNVDQIRGTGELHLDYFLGGRFPYCDSKWYASDYADDFVVLRVNTPVKYEGVEPNADITVTTFSAMYAGVRYRANGALQQKRMYKNETYTFKAPSSNFNDTETAIYGASQLSSIGDLSPLYPNYCDVSKAVKLVELILGNSNELYESRLENLSIGTLRLLKKLDIRNCRSLKTSVDLSGCPGIEEVYAEGSSITGLDLPDSGYLRVVHLPDTVSTLTFKKQNYIEDFQMPSYQNVEELVVAESPAVPLKDILLNSPALKRARLVNVELECTEDELSAIYSKLLSCGGIDETGLNTSKSVATGVIKVSSISEELRSNINRDFPELMLSVDGIILCTVSYYNADGTVLYVTTVRQGETAPDPVAEGIIDTPTIETTLEYLKTYTGWNDTLEDIQKSISFVATYHTKYGVSYYSGDKLEYIEYLEYGEDAIDPISTGKINTPTKESTAQYHYTFSNWDKELTNITDFRVVDAVYIETLRSYKVTYMNEDTMLAEVSFDYGTYPEYPMKNPTKLNVEYPQDYKFLGWTPELVTVESDAVYYAVFSESDHILDSWETISSRIYDGTYKEAYPLGILKREKLYYPDGSTEMFEVELVDYDHDLLADGTGVAGMTFLCKKVLSDKYAMSESPLLNRAGWSESLMRKYLQETIYPALPGSLRSLIVDVKKTTSAGGASASVNDVVDTTDYLWLPSLIEIINTYGTTPIYAAEGNTYRYMIGENDDVSRSRRIRTNDGGYAQRYWTRSPVSYSNNEYWMISTLGGGISTYSASSKQGVIFGFCIGRKSK